MGLLRPIGDHCRRQQHARQPRPLLERPVFIEVLYASQQSSAAVQLLLSAAFCMALFPVFEISVQLCRTAWKNALLALIFVHCGVNYCNAVARATVALLGRFLPRLGPLHESGPFFVPWPPGPNCRVNGPAAGFCASLGSIQPPPPGRAANPPAESRPAAGPGSQGPPPDGRSRKTADSAFRPCRARD